MIDSEREHQSTPTPQTRVNTNCTRHDVKAFQLEVHLAPIDPTNHGKEILLQIDSHVS